MKIFLLIGIGLIVSAFISALIVRQYYKILATNPQALDQFQIENYSGVVKWLIISLVVVWLTLGGIFVSLQPPSNLDSTEIQCPITPERDINSASNQDHEYLAYSENLKSLQN